MLYRQSPGGFGLAGIFAYGNGRVAGAETSLFQRGSRAAFGAFVKITISGIAAQPVP